MQTKDRNHRNSCNLLSRDSQTFRALIHINLRRNFRLHAKFTEKLFQVQKIV